MMTIEAGFVENKRDKVGRPNNKMIRKKKKCMRPKRRRVLQKLFLSCREVFKGPGTVPLPRDVQKLCHILNRMKPEDVGLSKDLLFFQPGREVKGTPRIMCTTIYKCKNFSLCIFFLPQTAVIPLHNHPGMTVFSKLLVGSMHIKSYDWADSDKLEEPGPSTSVRLARLKANAVFTAPCNTSVLYPTSGGNIHEFTALTPCAVLDVLGPPYSKEDGRDCNYYKDFPYSSHSDGDGEEEAKERGSSYGWLEEIEMPEDLMDGVEYLGPPIRETNC